MRDARDPKAAASRPLPQTAIARRSRARRPDVDAGVREDGVELRPGAAHELLERGVGGQSRAVRARRGHRVERVREADQARLDRDQRAVEPRGVAEPVPPLVVVEHAADRLARFRCARDQPCARCRVRAHLVELGLRERTGLSEQLRREQELADVVQEAAHPHGLKACLLPTRASRRPRARDPRRGARGHASTGATPRPLPSGLRPRTAEFAVALPRPFSGERK